MARNVPEEETQVTEVLLVGCGNMGFAMLSGWIEAGRLQPGSIVAVEPDDALRQRVSGRGVRAFAQASELPDDIRPRLVVMAVKPQLMADILPAYKRFADEGAAFLSVAAGTRISLFERLLGARVPVIRCMPNTPASIGEGMMVTIANAHVDARLESFAEALLSANGKVASVEEEGLMDAVTAVSGSGPAYLFHFIECLRDAAAEEGLPEDIAAVLAMQTVAGAARLAAQSGEDPATLRRQVTSPNGTTAAALDVLMGEDRLRMLMREAVAAARRRSAELG